MSMRSVFAHATDVLALGPRGEGLGADYGVSPDKGVLLGNIAESMLLGPDHRGGGMVVVEAGTGLLVHLGTEHEISHFTESSLAYRFTVLFSYNCDHAIHSHVLELLSTF
jgi:hypothetical protein